MTIKRAGDKWRVLVEVGRKADGSRDRRCRTADTKREAQAIEAELVRMRDINNGRLKACTVEQFVEGYWWPMKEASLRQTSLDSYRQDLRLRIMPALARREMSEVSRADVQALVTSCKTEPVAKRTRALLRAIFNEALSMGVVQTNPAAGRFQMPRAAVHAHDSAQREQWLTTFAQHAPVLAAAKGQGEIEKIVVLGLCFGLRKEEILGLNAGDLDFGEGVVRVGAAYVQTSKGNVSQPTKTAESLRTVPMFDYPRKRLLELSEGMAPDEPFVQSTVTGGRMPPTTATHMMKRFVEANGLPYVTIKTLRHSFASACIDAGVDIAKVSRWLGHTNVTTTYNRYVKTRRADLDSAADEISRALARAGLE